MVGRVEGTVGEVEVARMVLHNNADCRITANAVCECIPVTLPAVRNRLSESYGKDVEMTGRCCDFVTRNHLKDAIETQIAQCPRVVRGLIVLRGDDHVESFAGCCDDAFPDVRIAVAG